MRELEAQLAAANGTPSQSQPYDEQQPASGGSRGETDPDLNDERTDQLRPGNHIPLEASSQEPSRAASAHESPVDVLAAGVFDHPSSGYMCYFGESGWGT